MSEASKNELILSKGLDNIVVAQTELSSIDGHNGVLTYRGINIHELAEKASYEEVVSLLWYEKLPTRQELEILERMLAENRELPGDVIDMMRKFPHSAVPMEVLRTVVSALAMYDPESEDTSREATQRKAVRLTAKFPTVVAAYDRLRNGKQPVAPNAELDHAANTLYMLHGERPEDLHAKALDTYFVLLADHGLNASTFATRAIISTMADLHSAITAALASLKGPLHGGANEATMRMFLDIGAVNKVEQWIADAFAQKRKIMGFGHRVYRTGDPRSHHLQRIAKELGERAGDTRWYEMSLSVEKAVQSHRELYPNVDFFSAAVLYYCDIPIDLFTPMFACSRIAGWSAHALEQYADNRLMRPQSEFIGPQENRFVPIDQR
jgi:citrate synthase